MMFSGRKQANNLQNHSFFDDQSPQKYLRAQTMESLNSKLAINITKIVQLFKERKAMLMKKAQIMLNQNHSKIDVIARAKFNQLRTQAKNLRDQAAITLVQNAQRFSGSKNIIQKIADINVSQLDAIQNKRNKEYYDGITKIQNQLKSKMAKYKIQSGQIQKLTDREREFFRQIQTYQTELIQALTNKVPGHINLAQKKQDQIDKVKLLLKNNKTAKDKKKKQLQLQLNSIVDLLQKNQAFVNRRKKQIEEMFGGYDSLEDFDQFYKNFQIVVENKMQDKRQDQKAIHLVIKLANYYQTEMQQIQKISQDEVLLFQNLSQSFRKNIRLAILQRAYLSNVQIDKSSLGQMINKCRNYRSTLQKYEGQNLKSKRQLEKISQFLNYFYPILKAISSQDVRRQQLRKELMKISSQQGELQKIQKKQRDYQFQLNNYLLQKQAFERQQQQCAKKGNLNDYKMKSNMLQKIQKDIQNHKSQRSLNAYNEYQAKLNIEIQRLNQKYSDLIQDILTQQKEMTCSSFLNKLSKRLSII